MKPLWNHEHFRSDIDPTTSRQRAVETRLTPKLAGYGQSGERPCHVLIRSSHQRGTNSRLVPRCQDALRAASSCHRKRLGVNEVDVLVATHEAFGGHDAETCCPARGSQPGAQTGRHALERQEVDQKVYNMFWRWQIDREIFLSISKRMALVAEAVRPRIGLSQRRTEQKRPR
jgi:hypothetical protein